MKYTYLTLAALLMAAPCVFAQDTQINAQANVEVNDKTKKDAVTTASRAKHFGAGAAKGAFGIAQILGLAAIAYCCYKVIDEHEHRELIKINRRTKEEISRRPVPPNRMFQSAIGAVALAAATTQLYGMYKVFGSSWQSFKQAFAKTNKNNEASQK